MLHSNYDCDGWQVFDVEPGIAVTVAGGPPSLPLWLEQRVSELWSEAIAINSTLFNGPVLSADVLSPTNISGHWTEYKRIVARARDWSLAASLHIQPLAVAGLIEGPDGIVFGKRPDNTVYQPSMWQLAPAGNVDPSAESQGTVDLHGALMTELREELGLSAGTVSDARPVCAVLHPSAGIVDVCISLQTRLTAADILQAHATLSDMEYPCIAIVPRRDLPAFLAGRAGSVAPQTHLFLARYGLGEA